MSICSLMLPEVFEYLAVVVIFRAFLGLNSRFNFLLTYDRDYRLNC
jgi:hypothetical protein